MFFACDAASHRPTSRYIFLAVVAWDKDGAVVACFDHRGHQKRNRDTNVLLISAGVLATNVPATTAIQRIKIRSKGVEFVAIFRA